MGKKNKGGKIDATRLLLGGYDRELERFGVKGMQFGRSSAGQEYRSPEDVEKDVIDAARNDYDLRRTLEAAASGKGKGKKILDKGFKNIGDVTNAANFSEKAAKRHGQGGDFSSASDYMGLTQSMVERDRRKHDEAIDKRTESMLEKHLKKARTGKSEEEEREPIILSERMQRSQDLLADVEEGLFGSREDGAVIDEYTFKPFGRKFDPFDTRNAELGMVQPKGLVVGTVPSGIEDITNDSPLDYTTEIAAMDMKDRYAYKVASVLKEAGVKTRGPGTKFGA